MKGEAKLTLLARLQGQPIRNLGLDRFAAMEDEYLMLPAVVAGQGMGIRAGTGDRRQHKCEEEGGRWPHWLDSNAGQVGTTSPLGSVNRAGLAERKRCDDRLERLAIFRHHLIAALHLADIGGQGAAGGVLE